MEWMRPISKGIIGDLKFYVEGEKKRKENSDRERERGEFFMGPPMDRVWSPRDFAYVIPKQIWLSQQDDAGIISQF